MGVICIASLHALPVLPYWTWLVLFHCMLSWFFLTGLHCFSSSPTGSFLLGIVCIVSHPSLVLHYWAWLVSSSLSMVCIVSFHASLVHPCLLWLALLHLMIHWFIIAGWCVIDSSLLGMACIVSLSSLVHHYCAWVVFFNVMLHWFFLTGHCLYCFTSWLTSSSLLGMVCIVSLRDLPVLSYWSSFVLYHFKPDWFIITEHGWFLPNCPWFAWFHFMLLWFFLTCYDLHCFTWWFTGLSLLVDALLIFPYWVWHVLFHFHHRFIIIVHELYSSTSNITGWSLLGIVCIVSLQASLIHRYRVWYVLFHCYRCFIFIGHGLYCFASLTGSALLSMVGFASFPCSFIITGHVLYSFTSPTASSLLCMICIVSVQAS